MLLLVKYCLWAVENNKTLLAAKLLWRGSLNLGYLDLMHGDVEKLLYQNIKTVSTTKNA